MIDNFLLRLCPFRWREPFDLGDLGCWQACEQILQIIKRVDAVTTATAQQGVDHRAAFASLRMVVKLEEAKRGFVLLPKRWVVERSFA